MTQMKRHQVVDPQTGRVDLRYNPCQSRKITLSLSGVDNPLLILLTLWVEQ